MPYDGFSDPPISNFEKLDIIFNHLKLGEKQYIDKIFKELKWKSINGNDKFILRDLIASSGIVEYEYMHHNEITFVIKVPLYTSLKQFGSFSNMKNAIDENEKEETKNSEEKKNLEMQKLRSENIKLVNELADHDKIKTQRNIAAIVSLITVALLIAKLLLGKQ